jgi:hypothetical protein
VWAPIIGGEGAEPCLKEGSHQKAQKMDGTKKQRAPKSSYRDRKKPSNGIKMLAKKVGGTNAAAPMLR